MKTLLSLVRDTFKGWLAAKSPRMGAALAYYTIFSITPLLVLVISMTGLLFGKEAIESEVFGEISALVGAEASKMLQSMISQTRQSSDGIFTSVLAGLTLLFGATGVFVQLQDALNTIWNVKPKPRKGWWVFLRKRFLSFALILGIGFLLLVSLVMSAALNLAGNYLTSRFESLEVVWSSIHMVVSFFLITFLFALMFKYLPDVRLRWSDVWVGAVVTGLLFVVGKFVLGMYLGSSAVLSGFGAAGGLVLILVWVYYSAQIFFLGAEFTQIYARHRGVECEPEQHAEPRPAPA